MDFSLTDEQIALKDSIIKFSQTELNKGLIERDKKSEFLRDSWNKCANFGIHGLPIPQKYGGSEADIITTPFYQGGKSIMPARILCVALRLQRGWR